MKQPPLRTGLRYGLYALLLLLVLSGTLIALVGGTETGSRWLSVRLLHMAGPPLTAGAVRGTLLGGLSVDDIHYQSGDVDVMAGSVSFRWQPTYLLFGRLSIVSLQADSLFFKIHTTATEAESSGLFEWPIPLVVALKNAELNDVHITVNDSTVVLDRLVLSAGLSDRLEIDKLVAAYAGLSVNVRGRMNLQAPYSLEATADWFYAAGGETRFDGRLHAEGDLSRITVLNELRQPVPFSVAGELLLKKSPRLVLTGKGQVLDWPLGGEQPVVSARNIDLDVEGWLDDYRVSLSAEVDNKALPPAQLQVHATGNTDAIQLTEFSVTVPGNPFRAAGNGTLRLKPELLFDGELDVSSGKNRLQFKGDLGRRIDLAWWLDAPALHNVYTGLAGTSKGRGRITGSWSRPELDGELSGTSLAYQDYSVNTIKVRASSVTAGGDARLRLHVEDLRVAGQQIRQMELNADGSVSRHDITLRAANDQLSLGLKLAGQFHDGIWSGQLMQGDIASAVFGRWLDNTPAAIEIAKANIRMERNCWQQQSAALCWHGSWSTAAGVDINAKLSALALESFNRLLSTGRQLHGQLNAGLKASGPLQQLQVLLNADASNGSLVVNAEGQATEEYGWRELTVSADRLAGNWKINGQMVLQQPGRIDADLNINAQQELDGRIKLALQDIGWLELFVPKTRNLGGAINLDGRIGGTVQSPLLSIQGQLKQGHAGLPELGITLQDATLQFRSTDRSAIAIDGALRSGDGTLKLSGRIVDVASANRRVELMLTGSDVTVVQLPSVRVIASPDLSIRSDSRQMAINGSVRLPEADIKMETLPAGAVTVSDDAVVVNSDQSVTVNKTPFHIVSDIKLILGDKVHFQGFGFETGLGGELNLSEKPGQLPQAYGELVVESGRYKAYGQKLKIERGKLTFHGPYDDPALAIRAVRETSDAIVGLDIGGTLKHPSSRLFSDPVLSDSETMAILLTGRPMSSASEADAAKLYQAIALLGIERGASIANQLADKFALDVVTVDSDSGTNQSSLLLGKYLTPDLYVRYAVGLFDQSNSVGLEYKLNKNFKLEAQSGTQQSMDLIYRIER